EAYMAPALREDPSLTTSVQRVRRLLEAGDFAGAHAALPELQQQVESAKINSGARRSARRALRDVDEGTSADAYCSARTWKRVTLGPRATIFQHGKYIWGFSPGFRSVSYSPGKSARLAADDCWRVVTGTGTALTGLFHSGQRAQISGPVGIVRSSQQALQIGFNWYLQLLGLISMSLALLNLLPLLPLDGGHILFSLIESVRRRSLAREVYERVSVIGMALIAILMYIALHNDVTGAGPR